jgi:transcriptional regulator of arginine metabolism
VGKPQRQHLIARLLETHSVTSQGQLAALLADEGMEATQTTVSRDLEELAPEDHLRRVLGEWVVELAVSSNLVVLRTPPGSAHVVGSALDRSGFEGVVGTVAGDDTVLVVAGEGLGGKALGEKLSQIAGLDGSTVSGGTT